LPPLFANSLVIGLGLGTLIAFATWAVFATWPGIAPAHGTIMALALAAIPVGLASLLLQNLQLALQDVRGYNRILLGTRILTVALLGVVIVLQVVTAETVLLSSLIVQALGLVWIVVSLYPHLDRRPLFSPHWIIQGIGYGIKAYASALFSFLVIRADLLMVSYLLGLEDAGYYATAASMADLMLTLPITVGTILFPKLSAMSDDREKWRYARHLAIMVGLLMFGLAIAAALLARPMILILYGESFLPSVPAFLWLLPAVVLLSVNTILMNYFAATGMPAIAVYSPAAAMALNVGLNSILIPSYGIVGAAAASVMAYGLMLLLSMVRIFGRRLAWSKLKLK
jgi:O-antigen/teichoic acid export membrane protein